ncbi:MAG: hypothetical protein Q8N18_15905 [Opitutaceae bacterium]|nr:hypothetical protein [Opitutaceae bacterium]
MKKSLLPIAAIGVLCFLASVRPSLAAAGLGPKAKIFAEFDTNKNSVIDGDEVAAVRKAFAADPKGQFAAYDKNKDGKLDDAEIADIKPPGANKGGGKKGTDTPKKNETK